MSAFVVSEDCINTLTFGILEALRYDPKVAHLIRDPDQLAITLLRENVESVSYRYDDDANRDQCDTRYAAPKTPPTAVAIFKALQCYDYQSCEHPGWPDSLACYMVHRAAMYWGGRVAEQARGYGALPWG